MINYIYCDYCKKITKSVNYITKKLSLLPYQKLLVVKCNKCNKVKFSKTIWTEDA